MTKINKLGKSTFVIAILSFLLVAVLAFGGTYAYFSAQTNTVSGTVTTGKLTIGTISGTTVATDAETFKFNDTLAQPNQVILDDTLSTTVTTNISYFTRVKFTVIVEVPEGNQHKHTDATQCGDYCGGKAINALTIADIATLNTNAESNITWAAGAVITEGENAADSVSSKYYYKLEPTVISDEEEDTKTESLKVKVQANAILGKYDGTANGCEYWQNVDITISVTFEVLQADYLYDGVTDGVKFADATEAERAWTEALAGAQVTPKQ